MSRNNNGAVRVGVVSSPGAHFVRNEEVVKLSTYTLPICSIIFLQFVKIYYQEKYHHSQSKIIGI
jgi:hypothetical protein